MGTPPPRVQKRPEMVLPMPEVALPGQEFSWSEDGLVGVEIERGVGGDGHADVGIRLPAAVKAMSMAVLMDVIFAPSMRVKVRRCVCASTTAMLLLLHQYHLEAKWFSDSYMGTPMSSACCSAACKATLAPLCVRVGTDAVAAAVGAMSNCPYRERIQLKYRTGRYNDVEALQ
jgi:hypothetical protein